jgi:ketosteroid isomerase-like protein
MGSFDDMNSDVWLPFMRAYSQLDIDLFSIIHASDFVRVESSSRWIGGLDSYRQRTDQGFARARAQGDVLSIEFRFTDRVLGDRLAYERGVYRVTVTEPDGQAQTFLGRFHSVLRRESGKWQLLLDHDDADGAVGRVEFERAHALDDFTPFDATR